MTGKAIVLAAVAAFAEPAEAGWNSTLDRIKGINIGKLVGT